LKSGKAFKGWADTAEEMLEEVRLRLQRLIHVERETYEGEEVHQKDHQNIQAV
jgi:hypothetical protein